MNETLQHGLLASLAAGLSSLLTSRLWARCFPARDIQNGEAGILAAICAVMGAVCGQYRAVVLGRSLEDNFIVMFCVGASTTLSWLLVRKHYGK